MKPASRIVSGQRGAVTPASGPTEGEGTSSVAYQKVLVRFGGETVY
uniref:Uncharacterized protein n=1 Tax=Thermosporothrix sp. COM3 TaxID=2490863 RepID=A0A455STL5_9CHLR|nr:hypothetical protein KTC_32350 [Thermosporothrix sp. COM3]